MSSDNRQNKLIQKILEDILTEAEHPRIDWDLFPFRVIRPEHEPDRPALLQHFFPVSLKLYYEVASEAAGMDVYLFLDCFGGEVLYQSGVILDKFLAETAVTDKDGRKQNLGDMLTPALRESLFEKITKYTIEQFLYNLGDQIEAAAEELLTESSLQAVAKLFAGLEHELIGMDITSSETKFIDEESKRIVAHVVAHRRASMKDGLTYFLEPHLEELGEHYRRLLPLWQDAKQLYKQNSSRASWRDIIKAALPDLKCEDDLISRLSGKLNDLPEEFQAKLSEKGGTSKPSSIALEDAARYCGAEPYQYSSRYLYYKLKKGGSDDELI